MKNKNNRKEHEVSKKLEKIIWQLNIKMKKEFLWALKKVYKINFN